MEPALQGALARFYDYLDRKVARLEADFPCLCCPQGCTICCNTSIFLVTKLEFVFLAHYVNEHFSREEITRFVEHSRAEVRAAPLEAHHVAESGIIDAPGLAQVCPFVTESGCSVYPARPSLCRLYGRSAHSDGQRVNLCPVLAKQVEESLGAELSSLKLPTVEHFTFVLGAWLKQVVAAKPQLQASLDDLMAINSLCAFVADTGLELGRLDEAISLI